MALPLKVLNNEGLAVEGSSVSLPALSSDELANFRMAHIVIDTASVHVSEDGTAAVAASAGGKKINPGGDFTIWGVENYNNVRMIRATSTSANAEITKEGVAS